MITYLLVAASALMLTMVAGLIYLARVPERTDAIVAILLFGTNGVAVVATLGFALQMPDLLDVALVLAMLSAVLGVTFALHGQGGRPGGGDS